MRRLGLILGILAVLAPLLIMADRPAAAQVVPPGTNVCLVAGSGSAFFGPLPSPGPFAGIGSLQQVSAGRDGAVYIADSGLQDDDLAGVTRLGDDGQLTLVQEEGRFLAGIRMGNPLDVAADATGAVWIVDGVRLARLNPDASSADLTALLPGDFSPQGVAVGADGSIYVEQYSPAFLMRITPDNTVSSLITPDAIISGVNDEAPFPPLAVVDASPGIDGVWVHAIGLEERIVFIGNDGAIGAVITPPEAIAGIDADDLGTVWFITDSGAIYQVDPLGLPAEVLSIGGAVIAGRTFDSQPRGLAVVGGSFFVGRTGDGVSQVIRIDDQACPTTPYVDGPVVCTVATSDSVSGLLPNSTSGYTPTGVAVDGASTVYSVWSGRGDDAGEGGVIATAGATSDVVVAAADVVDGRPLAFARHVAVSETTGELFVAEGLEFFAPPRVVRRTADGTWSTWVNESDDVSGSPIGNIVDMAMRDNTNLYLATDTRVIRTFEYFNGVETLQAVWQVALELGQVIGLALTGNSVSDEPFAWIADVERQRLYERVPDGGGINLATDFFDLDLDGSTAFSALRMAGDGDGVIMNLLLEKQLTRLVRRNADGTFTTIVGEFDLLDGLAVDQMTSIDVGPNGDYYLADSVNRRVLRLPASGDCDEPLPPLVSVAASVNCDEFANVIDALFIVQYEVTVRTPTYGCPLANPATELNIAFADVDGSGEVNIVDALFIAQCEVGVPNPACPDAGG